MIGRRRLAGRDGQEGQAVVLVAFFLLALLMAVGLAIDTGQLFIAKRTAQEAADAAAFAGGIVLYENGTVAQAIAAAKADATLNGYTDGANNAKVTVISPPTSGAFAGDPAYVEVIIVTSVRTSLVPQQAGFTNVTARGVGGAAALNLGYAVMALDQACDTGTAAVSSNGDLAITGGGIMINSCSPIAGQNSGNVTFTPNTYQTDVVGNVSGSWPNLRTGRVAQPDPFALYPKPLLNSLPTYTPQCAPQVNLPGIYTDIFGSNCHYSLAPGNYIFIGGGINLQGAKADICTGLSCSPPTAQGGVFLFFTSTTYPAIGGTCAQFKLEGGDDSTLSAPLAGTYQGMLMMFDSNCPLAQIYIGGGGSITTSGSIYAPTQTVFGNGNNSAVTVSQIVAKAFNAQNADFTVIYNRAVTANPVIPALVE